MAELAVIVVNWNGRHLLGECLSSLSDQSFADIEIWMVDNGSSDGSVDYVRKEFPNIRIIPLDKNFGFSAANNRAIESSSSPFVALFNNDAVADRHWAERLLSAAADPQVGIAASKVLLYSDRQKLDSAGDGMTIAGVGFKRGHLGPSGQHSDTEYVFGASGCAMLLRRSMLGDVGLLDDDFFFSYEDGDLCFRAQLRGWKCVYVPDAVVWHKLNASIGAMSRDRVYYGQRNVEYLYFKNMPGFLFWKYLPAHILNALLALLYFTGKGHFPAFVRSKIDFLKSLGGVLRKRGEIQSRRTVAVRQIDNLLDKRWLKTRMAGK